MTLSNWTAAAPEMTLLTLICVVLVADLFVSDEQRRLTFWLSLGALLVTAWSIVAI